MSEPAALPWKSPRFVALVAVLVLANLIIDLLWFKPEGIILFLIVEAAVIGAIVLAVRRWQPPPNGRGGASGDVANLVP